MTTPEISTAKPAVDPEKDAKQVVAKNTKTLYADIVPLAAGLFDKNTRISKEKMLTTLHRSILGLTKNGQARPLEDLKLFLAVANQYGLNPFKNEIYAVYMWDSSRSRDELTPIVSIHGLRKMARAGGVYTTPARPSSRTIKKRSFQNPSPCLCSAASPARLHRTK